MPSFTHRYDRQNITFSAKHSILFVIYRQKKKLNEREKRKKKDYVRKKNKNKPCWQKLGRLKRQEELKVRGKLKKKLNVDRFVQ